MIVNCYFICIRRTFSVPIERASVSLAILPVFQQMLRYARRFAAAVPGLAGPAALLISGCSCKSHLPVCCVGYSSPPSSVQAPWLEPPLNRGDAIDGWDDRWGEDVPLGTNSPNSGFFVNAAQWSHYRIEHYAYYWTNWRTLAPWSARTSSIFVDPMEWVLSLRSACEKWCFHFTRQPHGQVYDLCLASAVH